jgi:hypothetical protein
MTSRHPAESINSTTSRQSRRHALGQFGAAGLAVVAGSVPLRVHAQEATPAADGPEAAGYIVIRTYRYQPGGTIDEVVAPVAEGFVPIITAVPGFIEYFIVDLGPDRQCSVSIFTDRGGADESDRRAAGWAEEHLADVIQLPPAIVTGEIRLHVPPGSVEPVTSDPA